MTKLSGCLRHRGEVVGGNGNGILLQTNDATKSRVHVWFSGPLKDW